MARLWGREHSSSNVTTASTQQHQLFSPAQLTTRIFHWSQFPTDTTERVSKVIWQKAASPIVAARLNRSYNADRILGVLSVATRAWLWLDSKRRCPFLHFSQLSQCVTAGLVSVAGHWIWLSFSVGAVDRTEWRLNKRMQYRSRLFEIDVIPVCTSASMSSAISC